MMIYLTTKELDKERIEVPYLEYLVGSLVKKSSMIGLNKLLDLRQSLLRIKIELHCHLIPSIFKMIRSHLD